MRNPAIRRVQPRTLPLSHSACRLGQDGVIVSPSPMPPALSSTSASPC